MQQPGGDIIWLRLRGRERRAPLGVLHTQGLSQEDEAQGEEEAEYHQRWLAAFDA